MQKSCDIEIDFFALYCDSNFFASDAARAMNTNYNSQYNYNPTLNHIDERLGRIEQSIQNKFLLSGKRLAIGIGLAILSTCTVRYIWEKIEHYHPQIIDKPAVPPVTPQKTIADLLVEAP
jgi:hypothetical protein